MSSDKRIALVTGSSSGIGRAEAVALAKAGYDVVINYSKSEREARSTAGACEKLGAKTLVLQCDVADEASVIAMMDAITETFGRIDVLCNNAGASIKTAARDFEKVTVEEWDHIFGVNVKGVFLVAKHAVPLLKRSKDACIVNTNSIVGARPGPPPRSTDATEPRSSMPPPAGRTVPTRLRSGGWPRGCGTPMDWWAEMRAVRLPQ